MNHKSIAVRSLFLLLFILTFYIANAFIHPKSAATQQSGTWVLSEGSWYYKSDGELRNSWVEENYFVDESGRMVTGEWIYNDGKVHHSRRISRSDMARINMDELYYVGDDGMKVKNKTIYYTSISFDRDGRCSLSIDDLGFIEGTDSGLDGLRRYIVFHDGCKEYYF